MPPGSKQLVRVLQASGINERVDQSLS